MLIKVLVEKPFAYKKKKKKIPEGLVSDGSEIKYIRPLPHFLSLSLLQE